MKLNTDSGGVSLHAETIEDASTLFSIFHKTSPKQSEKGNRKVSFVRPHKYSNIPEDVREEIRSEYTGGSTISYLSRKYGIARATIDKLIKNKGIKRSYLKRSFDGKSIPVDVREKIVHAFLRGESVVKISLDYKISKGSVYGIVKQYRKKNNKHATIVDKLHDTGSIDPKVFNHASHSLETKAA